MSEKTPDFPLHRLNTPLTKLWMKGGVVRRSLAAALVAHKYRGGVGVCAADMSLIAVVDPRGVPRDLAPPFRVYELWQLANAPAPVIECPCAEYFDPEVGGRYGDRGAGAGHHPFCQFERTASVTYREAQGRAASRLGMEFEHGVPMAPQHGIRTRPAGGGIAQARPDEWNKLRQEYRGR